MRLVVASNRLPITVKREGEDAFTYKKTSGGLVTGIESLSKHMAFVWIGNISEDSLTAKDRTTITKDCWAQFRSVPVFISPEMNDKSYSGFCNGILWPALHAFPDDVCFTFPEYEAYREYNKIFAGEILKQAGDDDIVWVHDYHLMLVPEILKRERPALKVMFFLHIPFCEPSLLDALACCKSELVRGVSASDVIAFHTPDHALNFKASADAEGIDVGGRVRAIPIGIDPEMFRSSLKEPETIAKAKAFKERFADKRIILGVDRTDYIKGLPLKMKGFQRYLETHPEMSEKVVLLQVAVPSRLDVREYASYTMKICEIVSETNGRTGSIESTPIHFLFNSVSFGELCAIYSISDMMLITSVTDGMNLVALEYVACQDENHGVVVLSKFAGASATLQGCIEHNPNNTEEIVEAIELGLGLSSEEREERHEMNRRNIEIFTSVRWAEDNLEQVCKEWRKEIAVDDADLLPVEVKEYGDEQEEAKDDKEAKDSDTKVNDAKDSDTKKHKKKDKEDREDKRIEGKKKESQRNIKIKREKQKDGE